MILPRGHSELEDGKNSNYCNTNTEEVFTNNNIEQQQISVGKEGFRHAQQFYNNKITWNIRKIVLTRARRKLYARKILGKPRNITKYEEKRLHKPSKERRESLV